MHPNIIKEAALLFEAGAYKALDKINCSHCIGRFAIATSTQSRQDENKRRRIEDHSKPDGRRKKK